MCFFHSAENYNISDCHLFVCSVRATVFELINALAVSSGRTCLKRLSILILLQSEWPKLYRVLAILSAIGLTNDLSIVAFQYSGLTCD